ncbi:MAG: hypothetical protein L3J82_00060 [Planctomycetes bacterium]|nr:hypothetical protein [Planctomycetota bacterium]
MNQREQYQLSRRREKMYLLLFVFALTACQGLPSGVEVTHTKEFKPERYARNLEPVILIPGSLGSRLYNTKTGEIAWGNFKSLISDLEDGLELPIDKPRLSENKDNLEAYRVLDRAEVFNPEGRGEISLYAQMIDHLSSTLGYRPAYGKRFHRRHNLFVFFYDWRRSNVEAATQLAEFIENIRRDLRQPKLKFKFVAISQGGHVARYYLRYGGQDVISDKPLNAPLKPTWAGLNACSGLTLIGSPIRGTVDAFKLLQEGYAPTALAKRNPPSTIFSFPAVFELLPDPGEPLFVGTGGEVMDFSIWDVSTWETHDLSVFSPEGFSNLKGRIRANAQPGDDRDAMYDQKMKQRRIWIKKVLTHAQRFKRSIECETGVPTGVILGVNSPTQARVGAILEDNHWRYHFGPRKSGRKLDPMDEKLFLTGDGVVTRRSGLGLYLPEATSELTAAGKNLRKSLQSWHFTQFEHRDMFEDDLLRLTLVELLANP